MKKPNKKILSYPTKLKGKGKNKRISIGEATKEELQVLLYEQIQDTIEAIDDMVRIFNITDGYTGYNI